MPKKTISLEILTASRTRVISPGTCTNRTQPPREERHKATRAYPELGQALGWLEK
jgi:hypothetical protein